MRTIFIFITLFVYNIAFAQKATAKAVNETCECMTALQAQKLDDAQLKEAGTACMTGALVDNIIGLADEYGYKLDEINATTGEQIGQKFGIQLAKDCPSSLPILILIGGDELKNKQGNIDNGIGYTSSGSSTGILEKVDGSGENVSITIKLEDGSKETFLWIRPFPGSVVLEKSHKKLKGKKITIQWKEFEKYVLDLKTYGKYKEVFGVTVD